MHRFLSFLSVLALLPFLYQAVVAKPSLEKVLRCPCSFSVSRLRDKSLQTDHDTFDLVITRTVSSKLSRKTNRNLSTFSKRQLSIKDASHSDGLFHHFHDLHIPDAGFFHVSVSHNSRNPRHTTDTPRYLLQLRPTSRQYVCPVMLNSDMPSPHYSSYTSEAYSQQPAIEGSSRQADDESPKFANRIAGGQFVNDKLMPYLVNIFSRSRRTFCSGTVLSARWVITAAHCDLGSTSDVYVMSTEIQFSDVNSGRPIGIKRVIRHPKFIVGTIGADPHDIALLELKQSIDEFKVKYMPVNFDPSVTAEGNYVRLVGYGRISSDESIPDLAPLSLRQVDAPIANFPECRRMYKKDLSVVINLQKKNHFCAGYTHDGGCDGCLGDSGGAVLMYYDNQPVLIGVITGGVSCGELGIPGVNVNIAAHEEWLLSSGAVFTKFKQSLSPVHAECSKGEYVVARDGRTGKCKKCARNMVSDGGATLKCRQCPESKVRDPHNGTVCSCKALAGKGLRNRRCVQCPKGSFAGVGDERCRPCGAGSFAPRVGMHRCWKCDGAARGASRCSA